MLTLDDAEYVSLKLGQLRIKFSMKCQGLLLDVGNEADCLINEQGGKIPPETMTLDDILPYYGTTVLSLCKTLAQQMNRKNNFVATKRVF